MTYQNQNTQTNNNFKSEAHQRARFYVIEHIFFFYDKPETNPVIGISKDPAFRDNPDHKGFCYTERTNDGYGWYLYTHGEFKTLEEAHKKMKYLAENHVNKERLTVSYDLLDYCA